MTQIVRPDVERLLAEDKKHKYFCSHCFCTVEFSPCERCGYETMDMKSQITPLCLYILNLENKLGEAEEILSDMPCDPRER